jgi:phosphoribosylformylglycinamidine cyclo-ligase
LERADIHGMAHITGGGFYENIPRLFPARRERALSAAVKNSSWRIPPVFARIASGVAGTGLAGAAAQAKGDALLDGDAALRKLMFNTYNMGIGFVIALPPDEGRAAVEYLDALGFPAWEIGRVEAAGAEALRFV